MATPRPRILILRGAQANPWDLRPWELLGDRFAVSCAMTKSNLHELGSLAVPLVEVAALSDLAPAGPVRRTAAILPLNRYVGLGEFLAQADIVHAAELSYWFTAQVAKNKPRYRYRLVVTVWETIPFGNAFRHPVSRRHRRMVVERADLFLAATDRARDALLLEGAAPERIRVCPPGIDLERFRRPSEPTAGEHMILSPGRLVWEKGHQDVIRALAAIHRGVVAAPPSARPRLVIAGAGGMRAGLIAYAHELGVGDHVQLVDNVAYDEMQRLYWSASCMTLASLPTRSWEEQFGMVLAEAMAAGVPIVASTSGAIPEVLGTSARYFSPGDWIGLASQLAEGPLSLPPCTPAEYPRDLVHRYSTRGAAERLEAAYDELA